MRLAPQPWMSSAQRVMDALERARPGCARFVGGCVRNALLAEPVADVDIATQLTPDKVEQVMLAAGIAVHPTGIEHGTLTVVADHHPFEVTTLRRDVETDGRRAVVAFTEDWAEDAQRRDFRMNALYAALDGAVFDPTGGGLDDIQFRRIVFVGDPEIRLREDYLRILRFFRFYAWYGHGAPDAAGLEACSQLKEGLSGISVERVWMETKKLLAAPDPVPSIEAMEAGGVLRQLFPQSKGLALLRQLVDLERSAAVKPDPMLRFLALFWKDAKAVVAASGALKMSNEESLRLKWTVQNDAPIRAGMTPADIRGALYKSGVPVFRDRVLLQWAQDMGASAGWRELYDSVAVWRRPVFQIAGEDLIERGIPEGPPVGAGLRKLETAWIESDFTLTRDELLGQIKRG
jgi:poly(A) polymerase